MLSFIIFRSCMFSTFLQRLTHTFSFDFVNKSPFISKINDSIRVRYVPNEVGSPRIEALYPTPLGFKYEVTFEYEVWFEQGFQWVKGGKLPGLRGGNPSIKTTGCIRPQPKNAWSNRIMWGPKGTAILYIYDQTRFFDNIACGISNSSNIPIFVPNKWINIKLYMKLNSETNKNDGIATMYIENKKIIHRPYITWYNITTTIDHVYFSTFYGGNDYSWAPLNTTFIRFRRPKLYNYNILNGL